MSQQPTSIRALGLIPARGGSKGIPHKNLAPLLGEPLIVHTIRAALHAPSLERVVVTTDDPAIAEVARAHGAEVPFLRPAALAQDDTPGIEPVVHALLWLEQEQGYRPTHVVLLQPTSPLRTSEDIEQALALAAREDADAVVSVCPARHHPAWTKRLLDDGRLAPFIAGAAMAPRRQDLPPAYALNGAVYVARREVVLARRSFHTERTWGHVMPPERSLDVDTPWDLRLAELVLGEHRARSASGERA